MEVPHDSAAPLLGIYLEERRSAYNRDIGTPMFIAALFTIAKLWNQPMYPTNDEWINKMWYIHTQWSIIQSQRMKLCHLQENGWN
jgi:hypothetical protein